MENINLNIVSVGIYKMILLDGVELMVYQNGDIYRTKFNKLKLINNVSNHNRGYNTIFINDKTLLRHRIMGHTFLNLDINNPKQQIDHIDGDRLNNNLTNLLN